MAFCSDDPCSNPDEVCKFFSVKLFETVGKWNRTDVLANQCEDEILPLWQNFNFWARFEGLLAVEKFGKSNIEWGKIYLLKMAKY